MTSLECSSKRMVLGPLPPESTMTSYSMLMVKKDVATLTRRTKTGIEDLSARQVSKEPPAKKGGATRTTS